NPLDPRPELPRLPVAPAAPTTPGVYEIPVPVAVPGTAPVLPPTTANEVASPMPRLNPVALPELPAAPAAETETAPVETTFSNAGEPVGASITVVAANAPAPASNGEIAQVIAFGIALACLATALSLSAPPGIRRRLF